MRFRDEEIRKLDLADRNDFCRFVIECLCGRRFEPYGIITEESLEQNPRRIYVGRLLRDSEWEELRKRMQDLASTGLQPSGSALKTEQLNEILLLLNQDRVSEGFFNYFFDRPVVDTESFKNGIQRFRGYALLRYGNIRYAFNQLRTKSESEISYELRDYDPSIQPRSLCSLSDRPGRILNIDEIDSEHHQYTGETTVGKSTREMKLLEKAVDGIDSLSKREKQDLETYYEYIHSKSASRREIEDMVQELHEEYSSLQDSIAATVERARKNTDVYLTWDFMDVYIATSMRNSWEFDECADFIRNLSRVLKDRWAHLRVFNPTQSKCRHRIDKGLLEGLMLKRVNCTVYMAQETDTMGKDSELAGTLAQGKPVIAYVPKTDPADIKEILDMPMPFFWKRFMSLMTEDIIFSEDLRNLVEDMGMKKEDIDRAVDFATTELTKLRKSRLFVFSQKTKEVDKKKIAERQDEFENLARVIAAAQSLHFQKRRQVLQEYHPLGLQVHLASGVANGVLVVESVEQCAELLRAILEREMRFIITRYQFPGQEEESKVLALIEETTNCVFRVQTDYERLSNSFWNLYHAEDESIPEPGDTTGSRVDGDADF